MTKKPFVGQSTLANSLLGLIHTDVYGSLNTQARGRYSYFITFIDDHSWYGYVYLMKYKFEALGRFKEYRLEVKNQTGQKIKAIQFNGGREYLNSEFVDYQNENGIRSQWTLLGTLQLNDGNVLETVAKLLNIAPSKMIPQIQYEIWHGKLASYKYLKVTTVISTTESEYVAASQAANEAVWMKNYIQELGVMPSIAEPVVIFSDNNGAIAQSKEPRSHHRSKHILRCYHFMKEMVSRGDIQMDRISSVENIPDPLTKLVSHIAHPQHLDKIGLRLISREWFPASMQ
ncbi:Retrovirus-related Pol polyprotein from transposon TNT 1-94 [Sesamum angolense]|uniref:Retrovirus-related Pol polyprotein from transposon TNT 1-94 n=1 Tax=Sesamum angolense TaxID=2727404 RepID=A0AAE2C570_9LAMI|nr:Retrovirus-related Pol polyprotein from transposon TNT 1-94 [Sesamum angolense]